MARFGRVLTAMITPFDQDGALDLDGAAKLASWLVEQGNEGLVIAGTTGESPTLYSSGTDRAVATVCQAVSVPVIAGAGSNDTKAAVELTEAATAAGAAAILSVTPYYNRPSQAGLVAHYRRSPRPPLCRSCSTTFPFAPDARLTPRRSSIWLTTVPNIVALKDAAGNPAETAALLTQAPEGFEVYSGDDALNLPLLSVGAVGVISVAGHWAAAEIGEMIDAYLRRRRAAGP